MKNYKRAFQITTHVGSEPVDMLLRKIFSHENVYLIYMDRKTLDAHQDLVRKYAAVDNVIFASDTLMAWGSASILDATLNGLKILADGFRWNQYVLISGQDFPVVPLDELDGRLDQEKNYIPCWSILNQAVDLDRPVGATPWDFSGDTPADRIIFSPRFSSVAVHPETEFRYQHHHDLMRFKYDFIIDNMRGTLSIANNLPFKNAFFRNWFGGASESGKERRIGFGQAWVALSRPFVDWLLSNPVAADCYFLTRQFLFPDEAYFQTAFLNSPFLKTHVSMPVSFSGDAVYGGRLDADVFEAARSGGYAFARKFDVNAVGELAAAYEAVVGRPFDSPTEDYKSVFC